MVFNCSPWLGRVPDGGLVAPTKGDCWVGVGVEDEAVPLAEESVLLAVRR